MFYFILIFLLCSSPAFAQQTLPGIGEWREHLPYNSAIDVAAGNNKIYCATPYSIFTVDLPGYNIERLSRVTGLNETGISTIRYDHQNNKLVIAYTNSNIDIINNRSVYNIPDIKRSAISGDKRINNIYISGKNYYLSSGLGVIVLDGERNEVRDSWIIGTGGNQVKVYGFTGDGNFFYAATEEGLKKAAITANLSDPANWILVTGNGLSAGPVQNVYTIQGKTFLQKKDSLFVQNNSIWNLLYTDGWPFTSSDISENRIHLCERKPTGLARLIVLNADGSVFRTIENTPAVSYPRKAITYNNELWIADQYSALSQFKTNSNFTRFSPNSPQGIASGEMTVNNSVFYATAGTVNESWNYQYNGDGIFVLKEGYWENINRYRYPVLDSMLDFIAIAIDRRDGSIWAGSFGGGLLHTKPGPVFEIFKQNYLGVTIGDPGSYRVSGLAFDRENNLWIANYGAAQQLRVRKNDGTWKNFTVPPPLFDNAVSQIIVDDKDQKWIVGAHGNGLICYDHGSSIDNTGDDRWKRFAAGSGAGNLPSNQVLCIEKDKNGFIWVGTAEGIGVLECAPEAFSASGCDAVWPVVPNGNFAGYLFKGQEVRSIITDGANRKWVATKSGVFLVKEDGTGVILHFTEDNSPLLSNDVKKITINGQTGEVYFATQNGICSYRGSATEGGEVNDDVTVFPNPVPAGYSGSIAIRGLVNNAIVKITELDGRLVYQTRALGGQAVWDGRNYRGQRISSGAYLVLVNDDGKKERMATKIFFISR